MNIINKIRNLFRKLLCVEYSIKAYFELQLTNYLDMKIFVQFVVEAEVQFLLTHQSDNGIKNTYLSVSKILSQSF